MRKADSPDNGRGPKNWEWSDGSIWDFENWASGKPSKSILIVKDRLEMFSTGSSGKWDSASHSNYKEAFYKCPSNRYLGCLFASPLGTLPLASYDDGSDNRHSVITSEMSPTSNLSEETPRVRSSTNQSHQCGRVAYAYSGSQRDCLVHLDAQGNSMYPSQTGIFELRGWRIGPLNSAKDTILKFPFYASVIKCDLTKAILVGYLSILIHDAIMIVTINILPAFLFRLQMISVLERIS